MPVSDEEKALVLVLQHNPVLEHAMQMTQVEPACRAHA
jgi:hypothetical protein